MVFKIGYVLRINPEKPGLFATLLPLKSQRTPFCRGDTGIYLLMYLKRGQDADLGGNLFSIRHEPVLHGRAERY